jgi:hypothetical protein
VSRIKRSGASLGARVCDPQHFVTTGATDIYEVLELARRCGSQSRAPPPVCLQTHLDACPDRSKLGSCRVQAFGARVCDPQHFVTTGATDTCEILELACRCGSQSRAPPPVCPQTHLDRSLC